MANQSIKKAFERMWEHTSAGLNTKVNTVDIINNVTTESTTKPLSATQGKVLKGLVDTNAGNITALNTSLGTLTETVNTLTSNNNTAHDNLSKRITDNSDAIGKRVKYDDIQDKLTSTDTKKPLSANQGKVLKGELTSLTTTVGDIKSYSIVKIDDTQVIADAVNTTLNLTGSNITITGTDSSNTIDFSIAEGTDSTLGLVKLTDAVDSESSVDSHIAATPAAVKAAYDLANKADKQATSNATAIDNQTKDTANRVVITNSTAGRFKASTITTSELEKLEGITVNIQEAIDSKAPISHAIGTADYGLGNNEHYGHVRLSAVTNSTSGETNGVAATPSAVKAAYDKAIGALETANTKLPSDNVNGTIYTLPIFTDTKKLGNSRTSEVYENNAFAYTKIDSSLVIQGGTQNSFNEGIRILPSKQNGWSNIFFSADETTSGHHNGGWLMGRRGAAGSTGMTGDFTIENNGSDGNGLTLRTNGEMLWNGHSLSLGNQKINIAYDSTNECLNFVFN